MGFNLDFWILDLGISMFGNEGVDLLKVVVVEMWSVIEYLIFELKKKREEDEYL